MLISSFSSLFFQRTTSAKEAAATVVEATVEAATVVEATVEAATSPPTVMNL